MDYPLGAQERGDDVERPGYLDDCGHAATAAPASS
jgi:hypothetical protein